MSLTVLDPPEVSRVDAPVDVDAYALAERVASDIMLGAYSAPRSTQVTIGASEIGKPCDAQLVYRMRQVPAVNFPDPLRSLVGLGLHLVLADVYRRLSGNTGRFLVEQSVSYGTTPGTTDIYDRWRHEVIDWKSTLLKRLRQVRREGPPRSYLTQLHVYGAALTAQGETPRYVSLVYLPIDGTLDDIWVYRTPFDPHEAEMTLARQARLSTLTPLTAAREPSRLCPWCAHYRPGSTDLATGCPGTDERNGNASERG